MLAKSAKFFSILLFISAILIAKNPEKPNNIKGKLRSVMSPQEYDIAFELLSQYDQVISKKLRQDIIKMTKGFKYYPFCELIGCLLGQSEVLKENKPTIFEETCRKVPVIKERVTIIQNILRMKKKPASNLLLQEIAKLTEGYTVLQLSILVFDLTEETEINLLDEKICLKKFKKIFDKLHSRQLKRLDMTLKEELPKKGSATKIDSSKKQKIADELLPAEDSSEKLYPLLNDVFHQNKILFSDAIKQLKVGKFRKNFRRGILLYGPPGVGKNAMIEAMVNESGCYLLSIKASGLVNYYQGSGAEAIRAVFAEAKEIESNKGVIILIDELQSLSPTTIDKDAKLLHKHSGQDYNNSLAQIWTEYDDCLKNHNNILVVATCNKFEVIDKRIRDRFKCVAFPFPSKRDAYEILKNKAQYYNISLSEEELQSCVQKMQGMSGRELTTFISDVGVYISNGMSKKKALQLVAKEQVNTKKDAQSNERFRQFINETIKSVAHGFGGSLGGWIAVGALTLFGLSVNKNLTDNIIKIPLNVKYIQSAAH